MKMRFLVVALTLLVTCWKWSEKVEAFTATPLYPSLSSAEKNQSQEPVQTAVLQFPSKALDLREERYYVDPQLVSACSMQVMEKNLLHFVSTGTQVASAFNQIKDERNLDEYIKLRTNSDKDPRKWNDYRNLYKKIIQKSAEVFGIPSALHACNLFRESYFRPEVVNASAGEKCQGSVLKGKIKLKACTSTTGAVGIGQFQPSRPKTKDRLGITGTIEAIDRILKSRLGNCGQGNDRKVIECEQAEADALWHDIIVPHHNRVRRSRSFEASGKYSDAIYRWNRYQLRKSWRQYFTSVKETIPNGFDRKAAANYKIAIPASAMWLKFSMLELDSSLAARGRASLAYDSQGRVLLDFFGVLAGLYNRGNGHIEKSIMRCPTSVTCWKNALGRRAETAKHMDGVLYCMQAGNMCSPESGKIEGCVQKVYKDLDPKITKKYLDKKAREAKAKDQAKVAPSKKGKP